MGAIDRRKIETILREPLTRPRLLLNARVLAAQDPENPQPFTFNDLIAFYKQLSADAVTEAMNALTAIRTGRAPSAPQLKTPERQLVWGAAFAYLHLNPDAMKDWTPPGEAGALSKTALWAQVAGTRVVQQELVSHAYHVREALRDRDTRYMWSEPGTGFTYNRSTNVIGIDLMQTLTVGFEHARADVYRQIGHALLSLRYPARMQQIYKDMAPLLRRQRQAAAKKGPKLTPDEYKRLRMLSAEWELRHMMFVAAEENVANRFVANVGKQALQDYSVSLNNTAVTNRHIGLAHIPPGTSISDELRRYMNLCNAVQLSFFQNNALFENNDKGWASVGVDANLVRKTSTLKQRPADAKNDQDGISHPDFQHLRKLCGGPKGLENLQPKSSERIFGAANMKGRLIQMDNQRKAIIEEIWKLYGEELIQKVLAQTSENIDQQLEEAKQKQQQQQDQNQDQEQEQDQDQDNQEQDGDGQSSGKPQKGQKGKKGKKSEDQEQDQDSDPQDSNESDQDQSEEGSEQKNDKSQKKDKGKKDQKKKDQKSKDRDQQQEKGDSQDADGSDQEESEDGSSQGKDQDQDKDQEGDGQNGDQDEQEKDASGDLGADQDETVPVDGAGDMPQSKDSNETPADENDPSKDNDGADQDGDGAEDGNDADGDDADGNDAEDGEGSDADGDDDAKTMEELEQDLEQSEEDQEQDGEDAEADGEPQKGKSQKGQKSQKSQKGQKGSKGQKGGVGDGPPLNDLAKLNWEDYEKRISELRGPIEVTRRAFKEVQKRQMQVKPVRSKTMDTLPENGEMKERFNMEAHRNFILKKKLGSAGEDDLKRFHKDENKLTPTEIDIVIMIDGSRSMESRSGSNATPLESALQAAAILYEAAAGKDMKMNVYVGIWGDSQAPIFIRPGDDRVTVAKAMKKMQKGLNSGTSFAPAVVKVPETIGEQRGHSGTMSGFTHILVISDGDIADKGKSIEQLEILFQYSDMVTVDVAIIKTGSMSDSKMEKMPAEVKGRRSYHKMGTIIESDPNNIPMAILGLLVDKIRKCGSFIAVPKSKKRRDMKNAHNKMDKK